MVKKTLLKLTNKFYEKIEDKLNTAVVQYELEYNERQAPLIYNLLFTQYTDELGRDISRIYGKDKSDIIGASYLADLRMSLFQPKVKTKNDILEKFESLQHHTTNYFTNLSL